MTETTITEIVQNIIPADHRFRFKKFQRQDLARAAMHNGLVLSWDTGLGKSIAAYAWPLLKVGFTKTPERTIPNAPVILVIPGDLHAQTVKEGWDKFRVKTIPIESQDDFLRLTAHGALGNRGLPPDFYITSYSQLTTNGVARIPDPMDHDDPLALMEQWAIHHGDHVPVPETINGGETKEWSDRPDFATTCAFFAWRGKRWADEYSRIGAGVFDSIADINKSRDRAIEATEYMRDPDAREIAISKINEAWELLKNLACDQPDPQFKWLSPEQQIFIVRHFLDDKFTRYRASVGERRIYHKTPSTENSEGQWVLHTTRTSDGEISTSQNKFIPSRVLKLECTYCPSLADLAYESFACMVVDEGVKMKGEDTYVGQGVRKMNPKFRLVLTATPVKNRLPDIFRLAFWATGGHTDSTARWPYRDDSEERQRFAETFMVSERNISKEEAALTNGRSAPPGRYKKLTPEVCNIHLLWKLLGPIILRRRKDDTGEDIVPKVRKVIRCEMGTLQQKIYQYHLGAEYIDKNGDDAIGAQLQALRAAAADPTSESLRFQSEVTEPCQCTLKPVPPEEQLQRLQDQLAKLTEPRASASGLDAAIEVNGTVIPEANGQNEETEEKIAKIKAEIAKPVQRFDRVAPKDNCGTCKGAGGLPLPHRSGQPYIPKVASCLTLLEEILARKEQAVVFSAFNDPLDNLSRWLNEAEVPHVKLDGRVSQKRRGAHAGKFKEGRSTSDSIPVMLAGVECMAEGHSFHLANNVILICYSWAYDKFIQAINRVHRMNSARPVNVYVIVCPGTIDLRLESLIQDKGDAAELVLDGRLMSERAEEVNLADLLKIAHKEFDAGSETIDEALIHAQWPALRDKLKAAMTAWKAGLEQSPDREGGGTSTVTQKPIKSKPMRRNKMIRVTTPIAPTHDVKTSVPSAPRLNKVGQGSPSTPLNAEGASNASVSQPATFNPQPATDWKARLRARVTAMAGQARPDVWKQL